MVDNYPKRGRIYFSDSELLIVKAALSSYLELLGDIASRMSKTEIENSESFAGYFYDINKAVAKIAKECETRRK